MSRYQEHFTEISYQDFTTPHFTWQHIKWKEDLKYWEHTQTFMDSFYVITLRHGHTRPSEQLLLQNTMPRDMLLFYKRYLVYQG